MKPDTIQNDNNSNKSGHSNGEQNKNGAEFAPKWLPRWLFTLIGPLALFVLIIASVAAYFAYYYVSRDSARIQFWIGFMFSFLALVVVAVQVVIYAQQAEFMKQQVQKTDTIIDKMAAQLREMEAQTNTARDTIEASDRALRASQRAYVGIQRDPRLRLELGRYPEIEVYFVNTGRTPAHVKEFRYKFSSDKEGFGRSFVEYRGVKTDFFIFAGTPKRVHCVWNHQIIDDEWLKRIEDKASSIYLTGRLVYEDVWGVSSNFKTDVIRFEYFSFGAHELRENYEGDQDYIPADFIVELSGDETDEFTSEDEGPGEPPDYEPYDPFDI